MKKRNLIIAVIISCLICAAFGACGQAHVHTYMDEWSKDAESHWLTPLCSDVEAEKEAHNFINGECGTCGYKKDGDAQGHVHTYMDEWSKDENDHWLEPLCSDVEAEKESHNFIGNRCGTCGYEKNTVSAPETGDTTQLGNSAADMAALSVVSITSTFTYPSNYDAQAYGAGAIIKLDRTTFDAFVITNYHVIYDVNSTDEHKIAKKIDVYLFGSESTSAALSAEYIGGIMDKDVAVLKIEGEQVVTGNGVTPHRNSDILKKSAVQPITVGDSDEISIGDNVFVIGNAAGGGTSVTGGVVSVASEYMKMPALDTPTELLSSQYNPTGQGVTVKSMLVMRVDAAINHGNSGGGLFNARGEYVGTVEARAEGEVVGVGYAIPANLSVAIAEKIIANEDTHKATHANFGFTVRETESHSVYENGAARICQTIEVAQVLDNENSPTEGGLKLQEGDVFISYKIGDGKEIKIIHDYQLSNASYALKVGDKFTMKVKRNGREVTITYTCLQEKDFVTDINRNEA